MNKTNNFDFTMFYIKHKIYLPNTDRPSIKFLTWFVGFTEGEGSFIVNNRGDLAFIVTQSTSDIKVLDHIKEILGFGKVISQSIKTSRYITQNKREIEIIINLFNGNIILPTRKIIFNRFIEGYNNWVSKGRIRLDSVLYIDNLIYPSLSNSWLCGFTDGEGCFSCSIKKSKGFSFNFSIAQKGKANLPILKHLNSIFVNGIVSDHYVKDVYEYRIGGIKNCVSVFPYYDKHNLITKKSLSYLLWKSVYNDLLNRDHLDDEKRQILKEKVRLINKSNIK